MNTRILIVLYALLASSAVFAAVDEIHWTFTGQTYVTFDWRGPENSIRYRTASGTYGAPVIAATPNPIPTSSSGPF